MVISKRSNISKLIKYDGTTTNIVHLANGAEFEDVSFNPTEQEKINLVWQGFLMKRRPPREIRQQVDIDMKIEGFSIEIFTIRPRWDKPDEIVHSPIAKTTFVKSKNHWKLFWMRANLKWYG